MVQEVTKVYYVAHSGGTTKRESLDTQCMNHLFDENQMEVSLSCLTPLTLTMLTRFSFLHWED